MAQNRQQQTNSFFFFFYQELQRIKEEEADFTRYIRNHYRRHISPQFRQQLREQKFGMPLTAEEIKAQAKEKFAAKGRKELDELSQSLELCPRCSTLAILPEFVWGSQYWLCYYCYSKLIRGHRKPYESVGTRFLAFLCRDVELIVAGKQPRLWMRRKLPSDPDIRKALVRVHRHTYREAVMKQILDGVSIDISI